MMSLALALREMEQRRQSIGHQEGEWWFIMADTWSVTEAQAAPAEPDSGSALFEQELKGGRIVMCTGWFMDPCLSALADGRSAS